MSPRARLPLGIVLAACAAPSLAEELETATAPTTEISAYRAPVLLGETTQGFENPGRRARLSLSIRF